MLINNNTHTLLEELRRGHRRPVAPPCAPSLGPHDPRLVDALELSDLVSEVHQQLPLVLQLLSRDLALRGRGGGGLSSQPVAISVHVYW